MEIQVQIIRVVDASAIPAIVECKFCDAWGMMHVVHEKLSVLTAASVSADTGLPHNGAIACEVLRKWQDSAGRRIVTVTTAVPWDIETTKGISEFDLPD